MNHMLDLNVQGIHVTEYLYRSILWSDKVITYRSMIYEINEICQFQYKRVHISTCLGVAVVEKMEHEVRRP